MPTRYGTTLPTSRCGTPGRTPEILCPTDILYIPDQVDKQPETHTLITGQTNTFVSDPPKVTVTIQFKDSARASQPFTIAELPELAVQTTGADGTVSIVVPVTLASLTLAFTNDGETFVCGIGHLDPVHTFSGVVQRLQNLGYLDPDREYQVDDIAGVRYRLRELLAGQSGTPAADDNTSAAPDDNAGMNDDGTLDDATAQILSAAHGS